LKTRESLPVLYRPKLLDQLIGQQRIVDQLKGQFRSSRGVGKAFLLSGPSGTGKTTTSRMLAHYVNCEKFNAQEFMPCFECGYCQDVEHNRYQDVEEINCSSERGIDMIRGLVESTNYAPRHNARVYILDEVQQLTGAGQNALLKTLEEPPATTIFLLLTTDPHKLLPAIQNRCLQLSFQTVPDPEMIEHLDTIVRRERREVPVKALAHIATFSRGHVRQAISCLEGVFDALDGNPGFDPGDRNQLEKVVGQFADIDLVTVTKFLIDGLYTGRYAITLSAGLHVFDQNQQRSPGFLVGQILGQHIQTLYWLADPGRRYPNLMSSYHCHWYETLKRARETGKLKVTVASAAELVELLLDLQKELNRFELDARALLTAYVVKMVAAIQRHGQVQEE